MIKLSRWWNELPYWKRYNIIGAFVFGVGLLVALAVVGLIDKWWPQ